MLSAAFEKTAFVLSRRAGAWAIPTGWRLCHGFPRVGWDVDFMNLPLICLPDTGQNNAKNA
jgi:hypothetical protein